MKKMNKLIGIIFILTFVSCSLNEHSKIDRCLKETISKNNCMIELKNEKKDNKSNVELKLQCEKDSLLFFGKVLFDFAKSSEKEDLIYNNYAILNNHNQIILSINNRELSVILKKKTDFDSLVTSLRSKKFGLLFSNLDIKVVAQTDSSKTVKTISETFANSKNKFEGFVLTGDSYLSFASKVNEKLLIVTYSNDLQDKTIYGFSIN